MQQGTTAPPVHLLVRLVLPDKPPREFSYDFNQSVISMGRDPDNDIQIPLTTVSREHARIFHEVGDYFLEDLGSTHGTHHNKRKLQSGEKRLLRDGDSIEVMSFQIIFKTSAGTMLDRQPGEKTEQLARRMVQEVLSSLDSQVEPPAMRVMNGPDEGKRFVLSDETTEITIGRSPECDITLNDQNISRRHCLVKRTWHGFTAQDLGSKNGVLCNDKLIEGVQAIKDGDELQIGGVKLIFIDPPSRLLEQMGGLDGQTLDPSAGESEEAHEEEEVGEEEGYEEEAYEEDPEPEMEPEPEPEVAPEAPEGDELPELPPEVNQELEKVTSKGAASDALILVFAGIFLLGAVGLILFLLL